MNGELLAEAQQAQERLIDAERDVAVARAEFYRAVRRLHLHGSSLRELAADLGLSHQRVHQIVEEAGGSRRWTRIRSQAGQGQGQSQAGEHLAHHRLSCTFCGKHQNQVRKLIAGPGVFICGDCVALAKHVIAGGTTATTERGPIHAVPEQQPRAQCNFCGKRRDQVAGQAGIPVPEKTTGKANEKTTGKATGKPTGHAIICDQCLDLCAEIVAEDLAEP